MTEVVGTRGSPVILTPLSISLGRRGGDMACPRDTPTIVGPRRTGLPLADHGPDDGKPQKQSHYNIPGSQSPMNVAYGSQTGVAIHVCLPPID